ncbi:hypothetical protein [Kineococcus sp. SYSU DK005]|uniref:hypothetical protein n=1 Tax=Kineococcus sp. SYSU DK005 TaxID=3383126 RepID=UPI003D7D44F3
MRSSQLKDAWRRAVGKRRAGDAQRKPLDLRTDPHTPTTGTRVWALAAALFALATLVATGGRRGDVLAPGWVIGCAGGAALVCTLVWVLLYRRAKACGQVRGSSREN